MSGYVNVLNLKIVKKIQENYESIKKEAFNLFHVDGIIPKINAVMADQDGRFNGSKGKQKYVGKNSSLHIRVVTDLLDPPEAKIALANGAEENRQRRRSLCPVTMSILQPYINLDESIGNIGFNMLFPGAVITPHYGVITANKYIRFHMGLECDENCIFYLKENDGTIAPYIWENGEIMAFNDGTYLHWVEHKGIKPRTIVSIDIKKELLQTDI